MAISMKINEEWKKKHENEIIRGRKLDILFKQIDAKTKWGKLLGKKVKELAEFNQPVVFLHKANDHWEFYDKCNMGWFTFNHSDGTERAIYLDGRPGFMDYGENSFKCYMLDENIGVKLPQKPIITSEFVLDMQEKMNSDRLRLEKELGIKRSKEFRELIQLVIYGVLGLLVVLGVLYMAIGDLSFLMFWKSGNSVSAVQETINTTLSTTTTTLKNMVIL